jgi:glycosyltransferase involved in cell wall biosynthesis
MPRTAFKEKGCMMATLLAPIGILTRNRAGMLDATLRSLSATLLPETQPIVIFDDASDDPLTIQYLYENLPLAYQNNWPHSSDWAGAGLDILHKHNPCLAGLRDKLRVVPLGQVPQGVVNASCQMITQLFERYPAAPGVFLLQDDVVFNWPWYVRMAEAIQHQHSFPGRAPIGLLAGCRLNKRLTPLARSTNVVVISDGTTAQCCYLSKSVYEKQRAWFGKKHTLKAGFDNHLCRTVRSTGHTVCLMNPAVCQHIGLVSLVRPKIGWKARGASGRICYESRPPYVLADTVKAFHPCGSG